MLDYDAPEWVAWLAQDADGSWWGFEAEPNQYHHGWYENEVGRRVRLAQASPNPRWQESLRRRLRAAPDRSR